MKRVAAVLLAVVFVGCTEGALVTDVDPPAPPENLDASYYAGGVNVTWTLGGGWNGEAFRVYSRRITDGSFFFIAEVTSCADGACEYRDLNIAELEIYEYTVAAVAEGGFETRSPYSVEVEVPLWEAPPRPDAFGVIALDNANYLTWGTASRAVDDFSHYRVYFDDAGTDFLLGETDSEGFLDLLAANGATYGYFATAVDVWGHESTASAFAEGTPRPDYSGEWIYDFFAVPAASGFRFQDDESVLPIIDGASVDRHFRLETDVDGWWLVPGPDAVVYPVGFETTALKCGVGADAGCVDVATAPTNGYVTDDLLLAPQHTYVLRVRGDDAQLHYGAIRVTLLGYDQNDDPIMIFDWAYQLQGGNPSLSPRGG